MLLVKLQGGLGNQMFQYAFGRQLAIANNERLYLDTTEIYDKKNSNTPRKFELHVFQLAEHVRLKAKPRKFFSQLWQVSKIVEESFLYNDKYKRLRGNLYLDGYWQNEKYFSWAESVIRQDFTFLVPPSGWNVEALRKINESTAASIHFRRGDYLTLASANSFHGTCSLSYYEQAVELIISKVSNPHFFIFSDDPDWVRANFKIKHDHTFITWNQGKQSYEDLRLMAACQHHIVANSSFSWWGAWLGKNPAKTVIAPLRWFNEVPNDIVPAEWIRI